MCAGPDRIRHPVLQRHVRAAAVAGSGLLDGRARGRARIAAVGLERRLRSLLRAQLRSRLRAHVLLCAVHQIQLSAHRFRHRRLEGVLICDLMVWAWPCAPGQALGRAGSRSSTFFHLERSSSFVLWKSGPRSRI